MAPTRLSATFRITTPMFSAGADPEEAAHAELRPASFKGALRFWFRALAWAELGDVAAVREAEDELFGSTRTGQAKVLLSIAPSADLRELPKGTRLALGSGYLAGQGLAKQGGNGARTSRPAVDAGAQFDARFLLRADAAAPARERLERAIKALGLFGGLGARARRGFGGLTLERLTRDDKEIWAAPRDMEALAERIQEVRPGTFRDDREPPYTAFSPKSRLLLLPRPEGKDLQDSLGMALLHFRSFGRNGKNDSPPRAGHYVGAHEALQWFTNDHHDMLNVVLGEQVKGLVAPRRVAFGLPHNYYFKDRGSVEVNMAGKPKGGGRRASPLFLHVHQPLGASPVAIVAFLPATFLPGQDPKVSIGARKVPVPLPAKLWEPVDDFLNELLMPDTSELCARFPGAVEVPR